MTIADHQSSIENLLTGPVCRTREGCRRRVMALLIRERWALAWHFRLATADPEELARRLHALNHNIRRKNVIHRS